MNAALLAGSDANGLTALDVAHRIRLGIFEGDEGDGEVAKGGGGQFFVLRGTLVEQMRIGKIHFVAPLFEGDAEHLLAFDGIGAVIGVDLQNAISSFAFGT